MYGFEIEKLVAEIPLVAAHFLGVLSNDMSYLITEEKPGTFVILNTSNSDKEGEHWYFIYRAEINRYEIFDSLGYSEAKLEKNLSFLRGQNVVFNTDHLQGQRSGLCGQFCIMFAMHRILNLGVSFEVLLNKLFSSSAINNDKAVVTFITELKTS